MVFTWTGYSHSYKVEGRTTCSGKAGPTAPTGTREHMNQRLQNVGRSGHSVLEGSAGSAELSEAMPVLEQSVQLLPSGGSRSRLSPSAVSMV